MSQQEVTKKSFKFGPNELDPESKHINHWHVFVPEGVEFKELLRPEAWANIAAQLRPMARITVTSEPGYFVGELMVRSSGQLWANVVELSYKDLKEAVDIDVTDEYEAKWISNRYKFGIRRRSDGEWILKDLPDQAAANIALAAQVAETRKVG